MKTAMILTGTLLALALSLPARAQNLGAVMTRDQIVAEGEKMALAQFDAMGRNYWGRFWVDGVFWAGVADLSKVSQNPELREAIKKMGARKSNNAGPWCLFYVEPEKEPNHADDMCIAQVFLDYYEETKEPAVLVDTQRRIDLATESILSREMADNASKVHDLHWQQGLTWYWCDALFMAAPVHARLSAITGDPKYLQAMHVEWARTSDLVYDRDEHLFFRDKKYIERKTKSGQKLFWSRGNGWVMGALARILPYIPENDPLRSRYVDQLRDMSAKLASIQRPDGTWSPSLLDYDQFPYSETSGTALNTFAMAWGINNGVLDEKTYRPVVEKAWAALLAARTGKGFLGYVQGVGSEPDKVHADQFTWYGNGAFLMAAAQVAQMAPIKLPPAPQLSAAPPKAKN